MSQFAEPESITEYARSRWEEGELRVQRCAADSHKRDVLERVVEGIMAELERNIGQVFASAELVAIQDSSEPWCTRIAHELAPDAPWAWELDTVQNAAFHRYARRASDYRVGLG
ncbi:MAG: hypothetical protein JWM98_2257 [Thermoleophilia bacterium]|nr:hypothetical protein [Thermoleophilia bacterium]